MIYINNLVFSLQVCQSLLVDNCNIILRKWKNDITHTNEFRVYIIDKKIKCMCQQKLNHININIPSDIIFRSIQRCGIILLIK